MESGWCSWVVDFAMYLGETVFQLLLRQSSLRTTDEVGVLSHLPWIVQFESWRRLGIVRLSS